MSTKVDERYLSLAEAAERLGVSYPTIYRWVRSKKIAAVQPSGENGSWRVPESALPRPEPTPPPTPVQPRQVTGSMSRLVRDLEAKEAALKSLAG